MFTILIRFFRFVFHLISIHFDGSMMIMLLELLLFTSLLPSFFLLILIHSFSFSNSHEKHVYRVRFVGNIPFHSVSYLVCVYLHNQFILGSSLIWVYILVYFSLSLSSISLSLKFERMPSYFRGI